MLDSAAILTYHRQGTVKWFEIMPSKSRKTRSASKDRGDEWYRRAFADDYLIIYAHRSEREALSQVKVAIGHVPFEPGQRVLDIACGKGRHMLGFARMGARVAGVDLSPTLLRAARRRFRESPYRATFRRGDMRRLPYQNQFDGVTLWFTSFGYFPTETDNLRVMKSLAAAIKPGGWWWIDIPNPAHLIDNLAPESTRIVDGPDGEVEVKESRRIVGRRVVKKVLLTDSKGERSYDERVRLYTPEQFGSLVKRAGLVTDGILGDYDGSALAVLNPRQIWYGRKPLP
jgi:SAM-dependent methyltransferase